MNTTPVFPHAHPDTRHASSVWDCLLELGLDVCRADAGARQAFSAEHERAYAAGYDNPKHLAARLFVWYVADSGFFNASYLTETGSISGSISTMRTWVQTDPSLAPAIELEVTALKLFLFQAFEGATAPRHAIQAAQDKLLEV